ncbi:MAG: hypothetical protein AAF280_02645 [Pseudomonadota bacterium]
MMRLLAFILMLAGAASAQEPTLTGQGGAIPATPHRIVSLMDALVTTWLYEFGLPVVASHHRVGTEGGIFGLTRLLRVTAKDAGIANDRAVDPEGIQALEQDLIVGVCGSFEGAERRVLIAPTVTIGSGLGDIDGLATQETFATVLDATDQFPKLLLKNDERADQVRAALPEDLKAASFAALWLVDCDVHLFRTASPAVDVMVDPGLHSLARMQERHGHSLTLPISPETLQGVDAAMRLMIVQPADGRKLSTAANAKMEAFLSWYRVLFAAREDRFHYLDANAVLTNTCHRAHRTLNGIEAQVANDVASTTGKAAMCAGGLSKASGLQVGYPRPTPP